MKFATLAAIFLLGFSNALPAQTPASAQPATAPTAPLAADDLDTLRAHVGETVDITGTPTGTGHSKSGTVAYLNFGKAHAAVAVVAFLKADAAADPAAHKVQSEDDLKPFLGKPVVVHGKLANYKGDLQIVLDSLDQIKPAP